MRRSLKSKISLAVFTLAASVLIVTGFGLLSYFEQAFKESISRQQFSLISHIANELGQKIKLSEEIITGIAADIPPASVVDPDSLQKILNRHQSSTHHIFDNGIFFFSAGGRLIAESPFRPDRRGKDYSYRSYFQKTVQAKTPLLSAPYISSQKHGHPAVNFTAPTFDNSGKLTGVLAGSVDLTQDNMLGGLAKITVGETGYLYLYSTDRLMIMHPNSSRIMKRDVPLGANILFDRAIEGFEGTGETVNSRGLHALATFKRIEGTDWILAANYPVSEAFAPIKVIRTYTILGIVLGLLLITCVTWLSMQRLTAPLLTMIEHIKASTGPHAKRQLPHVGTDDEIATLADSFNQLMAEINLKERAAEEQLDFFQTMIDTIPNPIYYKDYTGHYLGCNLAFEKIYGLGREEIIGHTIEEIVTPEVADEIQKADEELLSQTSGDFQIFEHNMPLADGERHDLLFYKALFSDTDGELAGLVGTIIDITQRKETELALQRAREFSENLIQNSAVPCFVIDTDHNVLIWTRACEALTGIQAHEVLGTSEHWKAFYPKARPCMADLIIDNDLDSILDLYQAFTSSPQLEGGIRGEGWFPLIRGEERYLRFDAAPILDADGNLLAAIETLHDLTSVKKAEQALRDSEESFRTLVQRSPDAILVHRSGKILFANPSAAQLFVFESEKSMAKMDIMDLIHPDFQNIERDRIRAVELKRIEIPYLEEKIVCTNDNIIDVEVGSSPVFYKDNWAVQTILRNISERKAIQEKIWYQANFDALTDIPNRSLFLDRLQQSLENADREEHYVALIFIDLDHFKEVNDTLGHESGDILLQQAAKRLAESTRKTDTVARLGGDEFTVILPKVTDPANVRIVINRILKNLAEPFDLPGGQGNISGSIGAALYPVDGDNVTNLLKNADSAMYQAKEKGRNAGCFYSTPELHPNKKITTDETSTD